ncbi:hypothetical protein FQN57_006826 [Myotisia sp. PD_48]|nr:hypothetical protein FQN57_006826 [Myotisia sp. PD_48]
MPFHPTDAHNASRKSSAHFQGSFEATMNNTNSHGRFVPGTIGSGPDNGPSPLVTSKLGNVQTVPNENTLPGKKEQITPGNVPFSQPSVMDQILAKLSPRNQPTSETTAGDENLFKPTDSHLRLGTKPSSDKSSRPAPQGSHLNTFGDTRDPASFNRTIPMPASSSMDHSESAAQQQPLGTNEMIRLQQELQAANSRIAMQEQELAQTRVIKHTLDQAMGPPSEVDFGGREITDHTLSTLQSAFNASTRPLAQHQDSWMAQDDAVSDISDALSAGGFNRARGRWHGNSQPPVGTNDFGNNEKGFMMADTATNPDHSRNWGGRMGQQGPNSQSGFAPHHRMFSGPGNPPYGFDNRYASEPLAPLAGPGSRRSAPMNRGGSCFPPQNSPWGTFTALTPTAPIARVPSQQQVGSFQQPNMFPSVNAYQPRPVGTPLSPTAAEFTSLSTTAESWAPSVASGSGATYVSPLEPLNYRRLLDKTVSCDWKYIVDKIVCNNDQQASIFLQQKLKVGTAEQKYEIVEAIVNQAYPLMVNRFGNFLVQRCFEHGTPEQIIAIANAVRGNTLSLSMDPFGCHVIQKAFDCVPEEHKAVMVHELLRRIPETVIHRYACHVWQKLFELRWSGEPPQIMAKVNEALRGMWHEVALGETGSLVVQNIFENCVEDEKRQAIEEVLAKIDLLAHGQFGNWCIQHICEHGAPPDKSRAIEHILLWTTDYSMDQFASKVVEKCLKIGGSEFLDRYLQRVCTGRPDRPRMPLIDIAGDQYGNYLIQWILLNAGAQHRELVASHIRKHMVSLRGSKFGSRVAMLCCNPNHITRPGPGAGIQISRFGNPNEDRSTASSVSGSMSGSRFNRNSQWSSNYPPFR